MPRIQGLRESGHRNSDVAIKSAEGFVFSITIAWSGGTAGHKVILRDGTDASAPIEVVFAFPTTDGTITKEWPQGKHFSTGIFLDVGASAAEVEMTYK